MNRDEKPNAPIVYELHRALESHRLFLYFFEHPRHKHSPKVQHGERHQFRILSLNLEVELVGTSIELPIWEQ